MRYPRAEWVPWKPAAPDGRPTYFAGQNRPTAVVLHVMQGYQSTVRRWAQRGHFGVSWHYSIARDGSIMQHLEHSDGGYHAGITAAKAAADPPTWELWRGPGQNVNTYTLGIEHEGFAGEPFAPAQAKVSRELCRWLARQLDIPMDEAHFPPHAAIDLRDRPNDFNTPALRREFYDFLFKPEEEPMDAACIEELERRLSRVERITGAHGIDVDGERLRGDEALDDLDRRGASLALYAERLNTAILDHLADHESGRL